MLPECLVISNFIRILFNYVLCKKSNWLDSIRLKVQRNGIQDIDRLDRAARAAGQEASLCQDIEQAVPIPVWTRPPRAAQELPPEDWDSRNLAEDHEPAFEVGETLDPPRWWQLLRDRAFALEGG